MPYGVRNCPGPSPWDPRWRIVLPWGLRMATSWDRASLTRINPSGSAEMKYGKVRGMEAFTVPNCYSGFPSKLLQWFPVQTQGLHPEVARISDKDSAPPCVDCHVTRSRTVRLRSPSSQRQWQTSSFSAGRPGSYCSLGPPHRSHRHPFLWPMVPIMDKKWPSVKVNFSTRWFVLCVTKICPCRLAATPNGRLNWPGPLP